MLPGDLLRHLLEHGIGLSSDPARGSTDPQTVAEFVAYDIPFEVPPAEGFVFPPGGERD